MGNTYSKKKIVFLGTPGIAEPTLSLLSKQSDISIELVITQNEKSNIFQKASKLNIPVVIPKSLKDDTSIINKIKEIKPDFLVVVAFGQILSKEIIDIPKYGCLNGHVSLLPKYRGSCPIQAAILNGDDKTGITIMKMDSGIDTGDILYQTKINLKGEETTGLLFDTCGYIIAKDMLKVIEEYDKITPVKQDNSKASYVKMIKGEDGLIDFSNENSYEIERKLRAYTPWPGIYYFNNEGKRIKILDLHIYSDEVDMTIDELTFRCKDGVNIRVTKLIPEGKKPMSDIDYINGRRNK